MSEINLSNKLVSIENEINELKKQTVQSMIMIGKKLIEAKTEVNHGEWGKWLEERVQFTQRTANNFMRIAEEFSSNQKLISNLDSTKVIALLDLPSEDRDIFIEKHELQSMSVRQIKDEIKKCKDAKIGSVIDYEWDTNTYSIPVEELKPLPNHSDFFPDRKGQEWIEFLKSISMNGIIEKVMITRDKTIISGHERVRACKDLGIQTVPCCYSCQREKHRKDMSDDQLKLYLFLTSNMKSRGIEYYIAVFWLDTLFNTNYRDGSGDFSHYVTDERVEAFNHDNRVMEKIFEKIRELKAVGANEETISGELAKLKKEYVPIP